MIHSNFDILNRPWWKLPFDERDVNYFILNVKRLQLAISLAVDNDNENDALFWKGYMDLHREHYLLECISAESDVDFTIDFVQQSLEKPVIPDTSSRLTKKVQNLQDAFTDIFPSTFFSNLPIDQFTPSFAQQLH